MRGSFPDTENPDVLEPEKEKPKHEEKRKRETEITPVDWGQPLVPPSKDTVLGTQLREIDTVSLPLLRSVLRDWVVQPAC